jgi:hypothetical protein
MGRNLPSADGRMDGFATRIAAAWTGGDRGLHNGGLA